MKKIILTTVLVSAFFTSNAFAVNVLPIQSKPFGQSYAEWVVDFSRWLYSVPLIDNPLFGSSNCTQPQVGKVWFVGTSGVPNAECEVPVGKAVFVPLKGYIDTYPYAFGPNPGETLEHFLKRDAQFVVDTYLAPPNGLSIDGKQVITPDDALKLRVSTSLFTLTGNPTLLPIDACIAYPSSNSAVADGWYAIIKGLTPGTHKFEFTDGTAMKVKIVNK
jgi:hypothetical protein